MFRQNRLERQAEQSFLRYLSHMEAIGRSDASRVFNTSDQRKLERQVEQRLATYMNYMDAHLDDAARHAVTIDITRVIQLNLEERKQSQAAGTRALESHSH